jgi:hypothetical protein
MAVNWLSRTFVNFDIDGKQTQYHCGPRCAKVGALSLDRSSEDPDAPIHLFNCDVAVSKVTGTQGQKEYQMDDRTALLAAGSIALDGTDRMVSGNSSVSSVDLAYQFSRYNNRTLWGNDITGRDEFTQRVGKFAIGSIAMLDYYNVNVTSFQVQGLKVKVGNVGVTLNCKKPQLVRKFPKEEIAFHFGK